MCISTEASFGLAGLLVPVGIYCIKTARERDRSTLPLALVPLFFGTQQLCEGLVWLGIDRNDARIVHGASLAYLFFATLFWLFWIPLIGFLSESRERIKLILGIDTLLGLAGGLTLYLPLVWNRETLMVSVVDHSIRYDITRSPALAFVSQLMWQIAYLSVVSLPMIVTSKDKRGMLVFATALILSAVISHAYFWYTFASVWCFFAAILSLVLAYVFHQLPPRLAPHGP